MTPITNHFTAKLLLAAAIVVSAQQPGISEASTSIKTSTKYYKISGKTTKELKSQMKRKGPRGYWAYAKWNVNWKNKGCRVSVKINYTFPKWVDMNKAPNSVRVKWKKMIIALKKHEKGHGNHGINAGREISKSNCKNPKSAIKKWAAEDKNFDRRTNHGRNQGVVLR